MIDPGKLRHRMTLYNSTGTKYRDAWFAVETMATQEIPAGAPMIDISDTVVIDPAETAAHRIMTAQLTGRYDAGIIPTMYLTWGTRRMEITDVTLDEVDRSTVSISVRQVI